MSQGEPAISFMAWRAFLQKMTAKLCKLYSSLKWRPIFNDQLRLHKSGEKNFAGIFFPPTKKGND
jgi:hypothetical protein